MINVQQHPNDTYARYYAFCPYCGCGVCGPLRRSRETAMADDRAHRNVCTEANGV